MLCGHVKHGHIARGQVSPQKILKMDYLKGILTHSHPNTSNVQFLRGHIGATGVNALLPPPPK